jgi:glutathione S-transferase
MIMKLYYFPRSTYSQKVLLAFYEKGVPFTPVVKYPGTDREELAKISPIAKVPILELDDGYKIPESSIIIEYLDTHYSSGTRLIPEGRDLSRQTRFHDRLADLYVNEPVAAIFFDGRKPEEKRNAEVVSNARARLDMMFAGLDDHLSKGRTWVMGDTFTMADCALVPSLALCRTVYPFERFQHLTAYASRAFERPSFLKIRDEVAAMPAPKV